MNIEHTKTANVNIESENPPRSVEIQKITAADKVRAWFDNVIDKEVLSKLNITMVIEFVRIKLSHLNELVLSAESSHIPSQILAREGIHEATPRLFDTAHNVSSECVFQFQKLFFDFLRAKMYALGGE